MNTDDLLNALKSIQDTLDAIPLKGQATPVTPVGVPDSPFAAPVAVPPPVIVPDPQFADRVAKLEASVDSLTKLFAGVERVSAPDGTQGIYFSTRVGIGSKWFLLQNDGHGVALCVASSTDPTAVYIQHDGDQVPDPTKKVEGKRVALMVRNTDFNEKGTNVAIDAVATNAPFGNVAINAEAQYSPSAPEKVTIITQSEWKS